MRISTPTQRSRPAASGRAFWGTSGDGIAWLDRAVLVASILCMGEILSALLGTQPMGEPSDDAVSRIQESGNALKQAILAGAYALNLALLLWRMKPRALLFLGAPVILLTLWCFASVAWSPIPEGTLRRAAAVMGPVVVGTLAGLRFNEIQLTRSLRYAAVLSITGSLAYTVALPAYGLDVHGQLRGLFAHKNLLGEFMGFSLLAIIYGFTEAKAVTAGQILLLLACGMCLVLSHSATPLISVSAGVAALGAVRLLRRSKGLLRCLVPAIAALAVAFGLLFASNIGYLMTEVLGRDPTFSGRTYIWAFVLRMIGERLWEGYGYGIFWLGLNAPGAFFWYWSKQFELHAHNGYLQMLLDTGLVGLGLMLIAMLTLAVRTTRLAGAGRSSLAAWIAMFIAYYLVECVSEPVLWEANGLPTTVFVWAVVRTNLETWLQSRRREAALAARSHPGEGSAPIPGGMQAGVQTW